MSNALLRRNSSKQGLQKLMRLTAQRSMEDAEEVERERRRRARDSFHRRGSGSAPGDTPTSPGGTSMSPGDTSAEEHMYDGGLKPSGSPSLEEDEGFSDWTQRRERRRQQRLQELNQGGEGGEGGEDEEEDTINKSAPIKIAQASFTASGRLQRKEQDESERARMEMERRKEEEEVIQAEKMRREKEREEEREEEQRKRNELMSRKREEIQRPNTKVEKRKEVKVSYTSKVFLHQEPKHNNFNGEAAAEDVTTNSNKTNRPARAVEPEEAEAILETEQRLEKIRRSLQEKESQELEQLRHRQVEAEEELEELRKRREERRRVRGEEERRREEEELQRLAKEEEERRRMKDDIERRRMEAAERMKSRSTSSGNEDEMFSPFSPKVPKHKITERTESLSRSLKKSNSFKKTQPIVLTSKIDDKLEQYAHAVENSQDVRAVKASLTDLPTSPEAITSKKSLFEAGEAWSQSPSRPATCKDTEGLKVGVANRITQWVKGPSDSSSRQSLCRPADLKPGDVMQKKNMWEIIGDSSGRPGQTQKGSAAGKKYKFVITGHGKYEKIPVDDEEFTNGKSDLYHDDY